MDTMTDISPAETATDEAVHPLTGECIDLTDMNTVGDAWQALKDQIRVLYDLKDCLEGALLDTVEPPESGKTAHLETANQHFVVTFGQNEQFDQRTLRQAAFLLGDRASQVLKTQFKVDKRSYRRFQKSTLTDPNLQEAQRLLEEARAVTPKKPYVRLK